MSMKNFSDTIGNRTRDLSACSTRTKKNCIICVLHETLSRRQIKHCEMRRTFITHGAEGRFIQGVSLLVPIVKKPYVR
jgi:hypothetical protein